MEKETRIKVVVFVSIVLVLALLGMIEGWSMTSAAVGSILLGMFITPLFKKRAIRCCVWVASVCLGLLFFNYLSMSLEEWLRSNKAIEIIGDFTFYLQQIGKSAFKALTTGRRELLANNNPDFLATAGANPGFLISAIALVFGLLFWMIKNPEKEK